MGEILQRAQVVREARLWLGTRYHHGARLRGIGVDCAMMLAEVYAECGLIARVEPGEVAHDWHLHRTAEVFEGWVQRVGGRPVDTPAEGDIGLWRYGHTYSHGGIVVGRAGQAWSVVHALLAHRQVRETRTDEHPLAGAPVRWYSLWGAR